MNKVVGVGIYSFIVFLLMVVTVLIVMFFTGERGKYIKCVPVPDQEQEQEQGEDSLVIHIDDRQEEITIVGKKVGGTDVKIFNDVEIMAEWFHSNGFSQFWLDRVSGRLKITERLSGEDNNEKVDILTCHVITPKL